MKLAVTLQQSNAHVFIKELGEEPKTEADWAAAFDLFEERKSK